MVATVQQFLTNTATQNLPRVAPHIVNYCMASYAHFVHQLWAWRTRYTVMVARMCSWMTARLRADAAFNTVWQRGPASHRGVKYDGTAVA